MRCTESRVVLPATVLAAAIAALLLAGCAGRGLAAADAVEPPTARELALAPADSAVAAARVAGAASAQSIANFAAASAPQPAQPRRAEPRYPRLDAPAVPRSFAELQQQFARRLVAAHPDSSFTTRTPDRLLAIPVIEAALNADGSVRSTRVLRRPTTGDATTALAIAAIRRAAPYGDVSRLPKPWTVVETFLFDDALRFKPRTLDLD